MARIVLIIESKENRHLLDSFLSAYHSVGEHDPAAPLDELFDLCIVDDPSLAHFKAQLEARRETEQPAFLPVLLLTQRQDVWAQNPELWQFVDGSMTRP